MKEATGELNMTVVDTSAKTKVERSGKNYICNCADGTKITLDEKGQFTGDN